jgi:HK97 family phage portal protein
MGYLTNVINAVMGRQAGHAAESRSIEDPSVSIADAISDIGSIGSTSGESVSPKRALSIPALYQAVSAISGDVAKIPLAVYKRRPDGGRDIMRDHHAFRYVNLIGMANRECNAFKFWRRMMVSALLWNNGYAWIDRNGRGEVLGLYNLLPDRTRPIRVKGRLWYATEVKGKLEYLPAEDVFHLEGLSLDGFHGENLIGLFRDLFGQALAKRKFSSKFFKNGMMAGGVLAVPPGAKPATVKKVQAGLQQKYSSTDNAFRTLVLRDGYKWFSTQVDPQKAQLNESNEQDARDIARCFNLKASRLSVEGSTSYNSEEAAKQDYHDGTLSHWLIGARCEANAKLRTQQEVDEDLVYFDYKINALQWADAATRATIAKDGILNGRWSPNETREWENMNPYDGGDTFYTPLNTTPVGTHPNATDPAPDPAAGNRNLLGISDQRGSAVEKAAQQMAQSAFTRAENRLRIKADRAKTPDSKRAAVEAELPAVREMITDACVVTGQAVDEAVGLLTQKVLAA